MTRASSEPNLSAIQRLTLIRTLNQLPMPQFEELVFSLNPPAGILPSTLAAQGNRTSVLLQWAEGSGPGLVQVQELLSAITGEPTDAPAPNPVTDSLFLVPRRNSFFTGRDSILSQLHETLATGEPVALSGLGGVGKTQIATEYAHRYRDAYTHVLWVRAETQDELISGLTALAQDLGLPLSQEADQAVVVQTVKSWFQSQKDWLLVLDNADYLELVQEWLQLKDQGHILLTTRVSETRPLANCIGVMTMPLQEAALFLLRRSGKLRNDGTWAEATKVEHALSLKLCQDMDGLPLALDQAGAYILESPSSLAEYDQLYQMAAPELLAQRGQNALDHPSVTITFSLATQIASQRSPALASFLKLCAFLAPDGIPEELFRDNATAFEPPLQEVLGNALNFVQLLKAASRFSLITRNVDEQTFSVHRLIQAVIRDGLDSAAQESLILQALEAMNQVFPEAEFANWPLCDRLLPHALSVLKWQQQYGVETASVGRLLNEAAVYLGERGRYRESETLFRKALSIRKRVLGEQHIDLANTLNNLGMLYVEQGNHSQAEPLLKTALALEKRLLGNEHPFVANTLNNLALIYSTQGLPDKAQALFQQSLRIKSKILGEKHPDVATIIHNLAVLHRKQADFNKAESLFQSALNLRTQALGEEHPDVSTTLSHLAVLYREQARFDEAERLFQTVLEMDGKLLGKMHPFYAATLNHLGILYRERRNYDKAMDLFQNALRKYEEILGKDHPKPEKIRGEIEELHKVLGLN